MTEFGRTARPNGTRGHRSRHGRRRLRDRAEARALGRRSPTGRASATVTTFLWILLGGILMSAIALVGSVTLVLRESTLRRSCCRWCPSRPAPSSAAPCST
jgi:hypothetical protein